MAGKSFLESVELSDDLGSGGGGSSSRSSSGRSWHSPRISFSNDFAQLGDLDHPGSNVGASLSPRHRPSSSSGEFEFTASATAASDRAAPPKNPPMLSADELFYKGKLLPLHLPPRIQMVQDLSELRMDPAPPGKNQPTAQMKQQQGSIVARSPPVALMRRERSLRSPARPLVVASTLKSSSYPPPGYTSRPSSPPKSGKCSSSSRWRDLFGFQRKSISSPKASSSSKQGVPAKLLKMIFNRSSSSNSSSSNAPEISPPDDPAEIVHDSSLVPLLKDSSSNSCDPEILALHSSSVSSTSSNSSSNWTASSANSSSSSSADFPDEIAIAPGRNSSRSKPDSNRGRASSRGRRSSAGISNARLHGQLQNSSAGKNSGSNLQRSGSNRKANSSTLSAKMQLQDHVLIGNSRPHSESNWRRPSDHKPSSSSVRVTPVLHVPACIGPSLRSVRVHGLRKLFSSSSSSNPPPSHSHGPGKPDRTVAVM
ncbi:probable membrane-associated kinase regulator 1 [Selaginella moellendorffii]|uniref:probable membrane-associated kinase regulator 1 n=1 Tax=Selaginella moellendorffii TaxID=88036 RepID=UPI000D1CB1FE|nr:probable membrane-associated kinase regulator 1 [Selaginella moellendorffii]|eukprot:XP_024527246.1 probable membrane-associated kinase regulator 1 [Selaginella moellendorffii]